jgi:hypothetical protein
MYRVTLLLLEVKQNMLIPVQAMAWLLDIFPEKW